MDSEIFAYQQALKQIEDTKPEGWEEILSAERSSLEYQAFMLRERLNELVVLKLQKLREYQEACSVFKQETSPSGEPVTYGVGTSDANNHHLERMHRDLEDRINYQTEVLLRVALSTQFAERMAMLLSIKDVRFAEHRAAEVSEKQTRQEYYAALDKFGGIGQFMTDLGLRTHALLQTPVSSAS